MTKEKFLYYIALDNLYIKHDLHWLALEYGLDYSYEVAKSLYHKFCEYSSHHKDELDYDNFINFFRVFEDEIMLFIYDDVDDFDIKGDN